MNFFLLCKQGVKEGFKNRKSQVEKVRQGKSQGLKIQTPAGEEFEFRFQDGKLIKVWNFQDRGVINGFTGRVLGSKVVPGSRYSEYYEAAVNKYGKPTLEGVQVMQNLMGAKWELSNAYWTFEDGSTLLVTDVLKQTGVTKSGFTDRIQMLAVWVFCFPGYYVYIGYGEGGDSTPTFRPMSLEMQEMFLSLCEYGR